MSAPVNNKKLLVGCLISAAILSVLVIVLMIFGMRAFVNFGIASDISEYIDRINTVKIETTHKQQLVSKLKALRKQANEGNHVDVLTWADSDEIFRILLHDKIITAEEFIKFNKEINYLQRQLPSKAPDNIQGNTDP